MLRQAVSFLPKRVELWERIAQLDVKRERNPEAIKDLLEGSKHFRRSKERQSAVRLLRLAVKIEPWQFESTLVLAWLPAQVRRAARGAQALPGPVRAQSLRSPAQGPRGDVPHVAHSRRGVALATRGAARSLARARPPAAAPRAPRPRTAAAPAPAIPAGVEDGSSGLVPARDLGAVGRRRRRPSRRRAGSSGASAPRRRRAGRRRPSPGRAGSRRPRARPGR